MTFKTRKRWSAAAIGLLALLLSARPGWCPNPVVRRRLIGGAPSLHAAGFTAASSQYLQIASSPSFVATGPISVAGWVWFNSLPTTFQRIVVKVNGTANDEWFMQYNPTGGGTGHPRIEWGYHTGAATYHLNEWSVDATSQTWHLFVGILNPGNANTIGISVDNGSIGYENFSADAPTTGTLPVTFGAESNLGATFLDGRIDAVGFWTRVLTQGDVTTLWNNNIGQRFPVLPSSLKTNLVAWWDMDTASWLDSSGGGFTLTPHNGVTVVAGKT